MFWSLDLVTEKSIANSFLKVWQKRSNLFPSLTKIAADRSACPRLAAPLWERLDGDEYDFIYLQNTKLMESTASWRALPRGELRT